MDIPVTLNVKSANVIPIIHCMQGDTPTLICTILNGTDPFNVDSGEFDLCVCEGETAKHKVVSINCNVNKNTVTVNLTKNETDEAGDLKLCISFSNTAQEIVVSTFPFILKATENPAYSAVGQKENIKALTDYVAEAKKYADVAKDSGENISEYADSAKKSAKSAAESATATKASEKLSKSYAVGQSGAREGEEADNSKYYSEKSAESERVALEAAETAGQRADEVLLSKTNAAASAKSAEQSAANADMDAKLSQSYCIGKSGIRDGEDTDNAMYYYEQSKTNADTAVQSATNAATSESNANSYMESARQSADIAVQSAESAANSEGVAAEKASEAEQSATNAKQSETNIKKAEESSNTMAQTARSYAVGDIDFRENEATDNAKYYSDKAKEYAEQAQAVAGGDFISNTEKGIAGGVAVLNDALAVEKAVADKKGNDILETYAEKTKVPSLVKVDGSTITKDEDGTLHGSTSIDIDSELSETSTNPVENRVITNELNKKADSKDIPTSLPANGGDADTVNGHTIKSDVPENAVFTDTIYTLPMASETQLGGVKTGSNIKNDDGVISISKENVVAALGYTPAQGTGAVSGVKGSAESSYRTGNVNITAANVGAANSITLDSDTNCLKLYSGSRLLSSVSMDTDLEIVTFADGTDNEIAAMLRAHYNNKLNIADYWAIGDKRKVTLSSMLATGVSEAHREQTVEFVIVDFDHDDLVTSINGHTKAAVTLMQLNCLCTSISDSFKNNEAGYMNSTNTEFISWSTCARRTWCNSVYLNALPYNFKNIVKTVKKKTAKTNKSSVIDVTQDKVFLASETELNAGVAHSTTGEGTQYKGFNTRVVTIAKQPASSSSAYSSNWWLRSPNVNYGYQFCYVNYNGYIDCTSASTEYGIAPFLCI